ncbi:septum formation protein Maf [Neosynechococcus sphagnicola sy1]|uniref:Nucleoside triphosphate pyrophosphatase n=1 Tax=Neosynechococcus sphagnicola sy1 TaxID=1497020 RepID=A0A098TLW0_9CYAN|nr:nucleoside triphosphate pyrophosphatase [Neosynechococcus sphagnicola]KGF71828.1 septum formation protein Maf [Neosynechococcus sphagnicola sy1]
MGTFVLASASPARYRLLQSAGITPLVFPSQVDESQVQLSDPLALVQALARLKAEAVAAQLPEEGAFPQLILGCDSVLALNGTIHGKPRDPDDAFQRWQQMRGQVGDLWTGHALVDGLAADRRLLVKAQVTRVYFAQISDREIADYIATGEPLNCAGCFALEGRGGLFIDKLEGCHSNVIGLSLPLLRQMVQQLGHEVSQFWQPA